jgi:hypothetical protein
LTTKEKLLLFWPWLVMACTLLFTLINYRNGELSGGALVIISTGMSIAGAILGVYNFFKVYLKKVFIQTEKSKDLENISDNILPSIIEEGSDYVSHQFKVRGEHDDSILMSDSVNRHLREKAKKIKLVEKEEWYGFLIREFKSDPEFYKNALLDCHFQSRESKSMFFNEEKISLFNTLKKDTAYLEVFKSNYFTSYLTNDLVTKDIINYKNKRTPKRIWMGITKYPFNPKSNRILNLENSKMSNHIGGNTIAFTQEGKMMFWRQGKSSKRSVGLLAPTGSGSLDYADFEFSMNRDSSLESMIVRGMERELLEEGHEEGERIVDFVEKTKIIGFYRWVNKAGLPGFLGVSKLKLGTIINPNTSETDNPDWLVTEYDVYDKKSLEFAIKDLKENRKNEISVPLFANLLALEQVLQEDEEYLQFIYPKN